jgi:OOP family OmpA-OmpF porin
VISLAVAAADWVGLVHPEITPPSNFHHLRDTTSLIVSRGVDQGFVQITQVGRAAPTARDVLAAPTKPDIAATAGLDVLSASGSDAAVVTALPLAERGTLADRLTSGGAQVLTDLAFDSGSAVLLQDAFASLNELAAFLKDNPGVQVVLVGHTDATGELGANIALSRERARSVRQRLLTEFDIPARQIDAEGVGYLSPRAPNDTEEGRVANRRVEVMLLSLGTE